jgi:hypothetical protein
MNSPVSKFSIHYESGSYFMTPQELLKRISSLTNEQQDAVDKFVTYLEENPKSANGDARAAIDAFMDEHAELMRLLAQ